MEKMVEFFKRYKLIVFVVLAILVFWICIFIISLMVKSHANRLENSYEMAAADITIVEKERTDKLDTLYGAVKATAKNEKDILASIAESRKKVNVYLDENNLGEAQKQMSVASDGIDVLVENYPEISATDAYKEFMKASATSESKIASNRSNYNQCVKEYRNFVEGSFTKLFLKISGYEVKDTSLLEFGTTYQDPKTYTWEE